MNGLNDQAKGKFRTTINTIRERLLADLAAACDQRYSLGAKDRSKVKLRGRDAWQYQRLQAWLQDPSRTHAKPADNLAELIKERAYTLTNRLVILMQLECRGLRRVKLVSQGRNRSPFLTEREFFFALLEGDDQGFAFILQQVWDQLALELPALFAWDEAQECLPVPGPTLLWLIDQLNDPYLAGAWTDDTTLGWLYQFWNDPDRKAVDEKLNTTSGKVEAHEIAYKTQLFTERYMVEWLVQNSLGALWLATCAKNGWRAQAHQLTEDLAARRADWNAKIARGEEQESTPMPVHGDEAWWKYYVPQEPGAETIANAVDSVQEIKVLDPAMGSGHFLVYVFDFLWQLYQDQARLRGETYSPEQVLTWIFTSNLHGIDIDSRAVQIGAAALYIKAQEKLAGFQVPQLHIVASDLGLGHLRVDDPAVKAFVTTLEKDVGLPPKSSHQLIEALRGAEYMGSLLQIDVEIERVMAKVQLIGESQAGSDPKERLLDALRTFIHDHDQGDDLGLRSLADQLGKGLRLIALLSKKYEVIVANPPYLGMAKLDPGIAETMSAFAEVAKGDLFTLFMARVDQLRSVNGVTAFINMHSWMFLSSYAGFREGCFKDNHYLAIAHMGRGGGFQDWADFDKVMQTIMFTWKSSHAPNKVGWYCRLNAFGNYQKSVQLLRQPTEYTHIFPQSRFAEIPGSPMIYWWPEEFRDAYHTSEKLRDVCEVRQGMATSSNARFLRKHYEIQYQDICCVKSGDDGVENKKWYPYVKGAAGNRWFESINECLVYKDDGLEVKQYANVVFTNWTGRIINRHLYFRQGLAFNKIGADGFLCRLRKYKSIFDVAGSSVFCSDPYQMQVLLSTGISGYVAQSINPTINNQTGDIENLPILDMIKDSKVYLARAEALYDCLFESTESNLEYAYQHLDPVTFEVEEARIRNEIDTEILAHFSAETALAIYREIGESVFNFPAWDKQKTSIPADFTEAYQASTSVEELCRRYRLHPDSILTIKAVLGLVHESQLQDEVFKHLSWAIGVLVGRFDVQTGGLVDLAAERLKEKEEKPDPARPKAHRHGLLYLSTLDDYDGLTRKLDTNAGSACLETLRGILAYKWGPEKAAEIWEQIHAVLVLDGRDDLSPVQQAKRNLGDWIRNNAFDRHLAIYENRPIYCPLVSARKNFFVWANIHAWTDNTLYSILANYLKPDAEILASRIRRLREERAKASSPRDVNALEREIAELDSVLDELQEFSSKITRLAEKGPDPAIQEVEAPYVMDLDDGVMVNSAALWELVLPLWKKPKEWWKSLSAPAGKKDFDWSHLAMRYWPQRVMEKVKQDPSLAVAHGDYGAFKGRDLFEELHPKAAKKWREQQAKQSGQDQPDNPELELGF